MMAGGRSDHIDFDAIPSFLPYLMLRAKAQEEVQSRSFPCHGTIEKCCEDHEISGCDECPDYLHFKEMDDEIERLFLKCLFDYARASGGNLVLKTENDPDVIELLKKMGIKHP